MARGHEHIYVRAPLHTAGLLPSSRNSGISPGSRSVVCADRAPRPSGAVPLVHDERGGTVFDREEAGAVDCIGKWGPLLDYREPSAESRTQHVASACAAIF